MTGEARRPSPGWLLLVAIAIALVAALLGTQASVHHDATTCTSSCHQDERERHLATPGHDQSVCQACHAVPRGASLRIAAASWLGTTPPAHGQLDPAACTACHGDTDPAWADVAATAGHRDHAHAKDVTCISCHQGSLHDGSSPVKSCLDCHADARVHARETAGTKEPPECLTCHGFSASRTGSKAHGHSALTVEACDGCHGATASGPAPHIAPSALHGGVDCKLCHDPHKGSGKDAAERPCVSCHRLVIDDKNPDLPKAHHVCTGCHEQHAPLQSAQKRCPECHEQARRTEATAQSTALRHDACASCHRPHDFAATPNGCVLCHSRERALVFGESPKQHQRCAACHEVHGPPPTAAACAECHDDRTKKQQRAPSPHQDCTHCHDPHAPHAETPTACAECHGQPVRQLLGEGPAPHRSDGCLTCHTPHGSPAAGPKACGGCHKDKLHAAKAGPKPHQQCANCHEPHAITKEKATCGGCHAEVVKPSGIHQGPCQGCHTPHGSPKITRKACVDCHTTQHPTKLPEGGPHKDCTSCHAPHQSAKAALEKCGTCHAKERTVAARWPKDSAHAGSCLNCHQRHDERTQAPCATCHAAEASSAHGGRHECIQCHLPHQPPFAGAGWWQRCESCHAKQAEASKKHTECRNCHQPHQFAEPSCTTCHKDIKKKGAHGMKAHADCSTCHQTHTASIPGRSECLSCHKDKRTHQTGAPQCQACHPFE